jgi:DNA-binding transcriptional regulator YhcF (GntR family)
LGKGKKPCAAGTSKKVKVIGTKKYVDNETGEIENFQVVSVEDRDFNFHKVWLESIVNSIDLIGNQKTKLAFWIIENLNKENQLVMTQRQIADKSGISLKTVSTTMKALLDSNFLRKINAGAYCVNPEVLCKGTRNGRLNVLFQYQALEHHEQQELEPEEHEDVKPSEKNEPNLFTDEQLKAV